MLEVIGAGNPDYKGQDWGDVWAKSPELNSLKGQVATIVRVGQAVEVDETTRDDREYAMPLYDQILTVTKRSFIAYWRLPDYAMVRFPVSRS